MGGCRLFRLEMNDEDVDILEKSESTFQYVEIVAVMISR